MDRATQRLCYVLQQEQPVLFGDERIAFTRTVTTIPELHTEAELAALQETQWIHEKGDVFNICVDYTRLLACGFDCKKAQLEQQMADFLRLGDSEKAHYIHCQIKVLNAIQDLADRYRALAIKQGNQTVAKVLANVPAKAPQNFLEALQMLRILHFTLWAGRNYHNTIGRFDQFLYPYFKQDMDAGIYTEETALELLEEFFLTFNRDSDLYPGMQQGDNGQTIVLGG
ncbi:MAG: pyruvate formate-lyase, partial [Rikenellaceae bacterium]|nr:pyruvate formate-lyase [Rikenellaceae bacterium]